VAGQLAQVDIGVQCEAAAVDPQQCLPVCGGLWRRDRDEAAQPAAALDGGIDAVGQVRRPQHEPPGSGIEASRLADRGAAAAARATSIIIDDR
jgi:hypothetical protein